MTLTIFLLTLGGGVLLAFGFGTLVRQELIGTTKFGEISRLALEIAEIPSRVKSALKGKTIPNTQLNRQSDFVGTPASEESYLLLSRHDDRRGQSILELVDLTTFEVRHTWSPDFDSLFDQINPDERDFRFLWRDKNFRQNLNHPILLDDLSIAFQSHTPLFFIDLHSRLKVVEQSDIYHHSIERDHQNNLWVPVQLCPTSFGREQVGPSCSFVAREFVDDGIAKLSADGKLLWTKSVIQILDQNQLGHLIFGAAPPLSRDPVHLNDIQPVLSDGPFWRKGDVFLSLRNLSMVVLYRPSSNEVVKVIQGGFSHQHDIEIISPTRISVFDNNHKNYLGQKEMEYSGIVIFDFSDNAFERYHQGSFDAFRIRNATGGKATIAPDGGFFVQDHENATYYYFDPDGAIRWDYVSRTASGDQINALFWSRILTSQKDIELVRLILERREH